MRFFKPFLCFVFVLISGLRLVAQETTGGLQGTVRDPSGAVVPGAKLEVTAKSLIGSKTVDTDENSYYRLSNLPPCTYPISVVPQGVPPPKRQIVIAVGH